MRAGTPRRWERAFIGPAGYRWALKGFSSGAKGFPAAGRGLRLLSSLRDVIRSHYGPTAVARAQCLCCVDIRAAACVPPRPQDREARAPRPGDARLAVCCSSIRSPSVCYGLSLFLSLSSCLSCRSTTPHPREHMFTNNEARATARSRKTNKQKGSRLRDSTGRLIYISVLAADAIRLPPARNWGRVSGSPLRGESEGLPVDVILSSSMETLCGW